MNRTRDSIIPTEAALLHLAVHFKEDGGEFYGYYIRPKGSKPKLRADANIYRTLDRLCRRGLLSSRWTNDPRGSRRRLRMYSLTSDGDAIAALLSPIPPCNRCQEERHG